MPGFDGTGPRGQGPMTGRGEGYCALELPDSGQVARGYAGLRGTPVRLVAPTARPTRVFYPGPVWGYRRPLGFGRPRRGIGQRFWGPGRRGGGRGRGRGRW
jgi:hypothetical protein